MDYIEIKAITDKLYYESMERKRSEQEVSALIAISKSVLEYHRFIDSARTIFDKCKEITGASAGYVALLTADGSENEVLFLDSGGLPCTVDPSLPMPIRGLREVAYRTGKVAYDNNFDRSEWVQYMPEGHVMLKNALFAPLNIKGKTVGLIGLANKPGDFDENDVRMTTAFGEYAAIALYNSRMIEGLENSEERFRSVIEAAGDAIISINSSEKIITWNKSAQSMFGYSSQEALNQPVTIIIPEKLHEAHTRGFNRVLATGESHLIGKTLELTGVRKNGAEFPLELSLTKWKTEEGIFFTAIIRDITPRKENERALKGYQLQLEQMVSERTAELVKANTKLEEEIAQHRQTEQQLRESEAQIRNSLKEKELLLREIHHRVKNNMQVISSLLHLQSELIEDQTLFDIFNDSRTRIRSMALVHEKLYGSKNMTDIDFGEYIRSLSYELLGVYKVQPEKIRVVLDVHSVSLSIDIAVPCGLVVNELLTNVFKHAFPDGRTGEVYIRLRRNKEGEIELVVSDNGIGFPDIPSPSKRSLGLELTTMLVENQIGGHIALNKNQGTAFTVTFHETSRQ